MSGGDIIKAVRTTAKLSLYKTDGSGRDSYIK